MNNNSETQNPKLRILLIEDNPGDVRLIKEMLKEASIQFEIESADRLSAGIGQVKLDGFDVILLDLGLPDSQGLVTLRKLNEIRPEAPVIVLTGLANEAVGTQAVKEGAQDYLIKGQLDHNLLSRSIRYAIERKKAEDLIVASEQQYRILVETMNEGLGVQDRNGIITYMNRRACEIFGYEPEELIGKPMDVLFDEEGLQKFKAQMEQRKHGKEESYEITWRRKDGSDVHTLVSPHVIYDAEGNFDGSFGVFVDITDRKKAESELWESEEKFKAIFESATDGILLANMETMKFYMGNKKIFQMLGYTEDEIINLGVTDIHPKADLPHVMEQFERQARREIELAVDIPVERKDGSVFYADINSYPVTLQGTKYLIGIFRDITERRQLEAAAAEQTKRFEAFFDNSISPLAFLDKDFNFIRVNKAYADADEKSISYFPGRNHFDLYPSKAKAIFEDVVRTKKSFKTFARPFVYAEHPERGVTYWDWTLTPILDTKGEVEFLVFSLLNVTEEQKSRESLRKNEEFVKSILESVGEGLIAIDPEYKIISANRAYCEMQKTRPDEIIGRCCYEVSHHKDKPCYMEGEECAPRHTFKTGEPSLTVHTHYDNNNNPIYIETRAYPMKDAEGKTFSVIEILNDITEKRTLESQLRHVQKMEAIGTLAGGIAHDFNNILNIIIGYASLMQMHMKHDDPKMEHLKEILSAGERAANLTRGLLTFSRKQVMEVRVVDLNEIVEDFRKMLARIIGEDIELRIVLAEKPLMVKADIVQIEQVLMNLASNAKDAMPKGGILTIDTTPVNIDSAFIKMHGYGEPGMHALITISDTGTGMDDRTRERIFEPFFTTKELGRGTGLGLSIVYGIIKQHNGYINCYSEQGKGTTFRIYLPLIKEKTEKIEMREAELPRRGTETVLIAEDDEGVRDMVRQSLEGFGYKVIEAVDGEDAVIKFKENKDKIDILLFDLIMPKKNGKDAYEDIKGIRHDIKVIFTSGYAADIIDRFGIKEGIEFISKPVSPNELLRKLREVLG
jgi:PAS domain S-box-containing protein